MSDSPLSSGRGTDEYRVTLDVYDGPLDLLLFLIRREEVDIYDIPIARVTEQYIAYIELLREMDPESVGEFLVLAATLMEIKSRMLLPTPPPEEADEEPIDPRATLVHQLLQYKKYKDVARQLEDAAAERLLRHPRQPVLPVHDPAEVELDNLEIWDLFDAFSRLLEQTGRRQAVHEVSVDDTPLALHAEDILDALERAGGMCRFTEVFAGRTRAEMIGLFLALLELIRARRVRASQDRPNEPILLHLMEVAPEPEDVETLPEDFEEVASVEPDDVGATTPGETDVADKAGDGAAAVDVAVSEPVCKPIDGIVPAPPAPQHNVDLEEQLENAPEPSREP